MSSTVIRASQRRRDSGQVIEQKCLMPMLLLLLRACCLLIAFYCPRKPQAASVRPSHASIRSPFCKFQLLPWTTHCDPLKAGSDGGVPFGVLASRMWWFAHGIMRTASRAELAYWPYYAHHTSTPRSHPGVFSRRVCGISPVSTEDKEPHPGNPSAGRLVLSCSFMLHLAFKPVLIFEHLYQSTV